MKPSRGVLSVLGLVILLLVAWGPMAAAKRTLQRRETSLAETPTITSSAVQPTSTPEQVSRVSPKRHRRRQRLILPDRGSQVRDTGSIPQHVSVSRHLVGDIFGVGSYITQRSDSVAPLVIGRADLLGARWVREELTATSLHQGPDAPYSWRPYDRIINQEHRAGLHILGLLDYSNTWAYGDHGTMPHTDISRLSADFARYAYAVARHFRGRIRYWQVWNEPNLKIFWHPTPNATDYATLLQAASQAIKQANPRARIVLGGMSGVDLNFIRAVAAHTDAFDVVAVHPYRNLPETRLLAQIQALRSLGKPVWFSEMGWAAGSNCYGCPTEDAQARYLVRLYALAAAGGVRHVFWYDLRDDQNRPDSPEAHFGLLRRDLSGKPAFVAYDVLSHVLADAYFLHADSLGSNGVYALRFEEHGQPVSLAWNTGPDAHEIHVPWPTSGATVLDLRGVDLGSASIGGGEASWKLPPDGSPVYFVAQPPQPQTVAPGPLLHFAPAHHHVAHHRRRKVRRAMHRPAVHRHLRARKQVKKVRRRLPVRHVVVQRAAQIVTVQPSPRPSPTSRSHRERALSPLPAVTPIWSAEASPTALSSPLPAPQATAATPDPTGTPPPSPSASWAPSPSATLPASPITFSTQSLSPAPNPSSTAPATSSTVPGTTATDVGNAVASPQPSPTE